jgi:hypothetical protein
LPDDHPEEERCRAAVANAIGLAEDFAKGLPCPSLESVVREIEACRAVAEGELVRDIVMAAVVQAVHAAAAALHFFGLRGEPEGGHPFGTAKPNPFPHLADLTADLAERDAFTAAVEAAAAIGPTDGFMKGAIDDYEKRLRLDIGSYPQAGSPIDPSSKGRWGRSSRRRRCDDARAPRHPGFVSGERDRKNGRMAPEAAVNEIARRYRGRVDIFEAAAAANGATAQRGGGG